MNQATKDDLIELLLSDPNYYICDDGSIWTCKAKHGTKLGSWRRIDQSLDRKYKAIYYKRIQLLVHRIIYRKFNGPLHPLLEVNHIDNKRDNNVPNNLELLTHAENMFQISVQGNLKGEKNPRSKLNNIDVINIKQLIKQNKSLTDISKQFNVSIVMIGYIKSGKYWNHIQI
jgi:hypothetical protein